MKVNICASLVSLPAFVVANVRDNVRLQYLQGMLVVFYNNKYIFDFCDFLLTQTPGATYNNDLVRYT